MNCASCGHENRDTARFCEECGSALKLVCSGCKAELRPKARFCDECGQPTSPANANPAVSSRPDAGRSGAAPSRPLPSAAPPTGEARKIVSIIFADLAGSTALHERLDPESVRLFMEKYYQAMRGAVESHDGTLIKFLGDGVMAAFGVPRVSEDDALRSVRAGMAMQEAFAELAREKFDELGELGLRVGINTGEVVVSSGNTDIVGDPVNITARLQQEARNGDVVIGESTQRLVGSWVTLMPLGRFALKGRSGGVKAFSVVSLDPPAGAATAVFVGREEELSRIHSTYEAAVNDATVRLAVLVGSPGLGKSRLVEEFCHRLGDGATILRAHCDADTGATFVPLVRALREFFQLDSRAAASEVEGVIAQALPEGDADHARISRGITSFLTGSVATPEETFFILRRLLGSLAEDRPAVLVLDDVHWAEPLLLEFIEHLVQWGSGLRLFVLLGARPEIREVRSSLVTPGGPVTEVVTLSGLDAGAAMRLAANTIGAADLPASLAAKVLATSEGNPLFLGELVRMLVDEGIIERKGERWIVSAALDTLEMPPTIHALLAARIERLKPEELTVLERAAVMGRQFSRGAVAELIPGDARDLDARLEALRRAELIERDTGWFLGEPVLRFHHVLIRDAAYRRLLKGTRAELHARLAAWIESKAEDVDEHEEILGWHLEQAHQLLRELGPLDPNGLELGQRASRHLASAGRHALALDDVALAANLLARALDRLEPDDPARPDLALDVCEALLAEGDVKRAASAIEVLEEASGDSERLKAWHTCFAGQLTVMTEPKGLQATADRVSTAARDLATLEDAAGEAKAHFVAAQALARLGKVGACESALDQALAAARRAGDRRRANAVLAGAPLAALWGPSPVTRASGRCLDVVRVLRITQGAPAVEAVALSCQGLLEALRGRTDAARRMIASARKMVEELGITHRLLETDVFSGRIDFLEGNHAEAERQFRAGFEGLRELGHGIDAARAAALLGRALLEQGRPDEADVASQESEKLAGDDLQASIAWRVVRARALVQRGDHAAAITLARSAVEIATATDALLDHADARLALATALRAAGNAAEADAEEKRAFELWETKGATELVERSRAAEKVPAVSAGPPAEEKSEADPVRPRVRANAALRNVELHHAAIAAHDLDALRDAASEAMEVIHHPTGARHGVDGMLGTYKGAFEAKNFHCEQTALATLGESLALVRQSFSHEGLEHGSFADVGPMELDCVMVWEAGEDGTCVRAEVFGPDRLTEALARLYERFAQRMPDGPERNRAEAIAHTFSVWLLENPLYNLEGAPGGGWDPGVVDPEFELIDHRAIGVHAIHGPGELDTFLKAVTDFEAATSFHQDLMALSRDTLLFRYVKTGTARHGGGPFERRLLVLLQVNSKGKMARTEVFDFEDEAGALKRFEELAGGADSKPAARRRVRPNAATRNVEQADAALRAGDTAAIDTLFSPNLEMIHHPTGTVTGRDAMPAMWRALSRMKGAAIENEPLATLGDSLALCRRWIQHEGGETKIGSIGPSETEAFLVVEVDHAEQAVRFEIFDAAHLGAAIARLYECYAKSMPEGPERKRAITIARSFGEAIHLVDLDRLAESMAPSYTCIDHRPLAAWSASNPQEMLEQQREQQQLVSDLVTRHEDVLALDPNGCLFRRSFVARSRESGGTVEHRFLVLALYGADGRIIRNEIWEAEQEAEALARYEELISGKVTQPSPQRRIRRTSAVVHIERLHDAIVKRDPETLGALLAEEMKVIDHPTGTSYGPEGLVETWELAFGAKNLRCDHVPLATLGDAMILIRQSMSIEGWEQGEFSPSGPIELDTFLVVQVDEHGQCIWAEVFAGDHLSEAIVRLFERYAEILPEGPEKERATNLVRTFSVACGPIDPEQFAPTMEPSFELRDHRTLSTWESHNPQELIEHYRAQNELVSGFSARDEDVLALTDDAYLLRRTYYGTAREGGGEFENRILMLVLIGDDGRSTWSEIWDAEQEAEALARFDELTTGREQGRRPHRCVRPNAVTEVWENAERAYAARDLEAAAALLAEDIQIIHHPTGQTFDRAEDIDAWRHFMKSGPPRLNVEPLATLGDSLGLGIFDASSSGMEGRGLDIGAYEMRWFILAEANTERRFSRVENFAIDHLSTAVTRLYERYAERMPEGPDRERAATIARSIAAWSGRIDPDRIAEAMDPGHRVIDHRSLGTWSARNAAEHLAHYRLQVELASDFTERTDDILALEPDACLRRHCFFGTLRSGGGAFENHVLVLMKFNERGLTDGGEVWEADQEAEALARFEELTTGREQGRRPHRRVRPNAVTTVWERTRRAFAERNLPAIEALTSEKVQIVHHPSGLTFDGAQNLESWQRAIRIESALIKFEPLATLGDTLALGFQNTSAAGLRSGNLDVGPYELNWAVLSETDEQGRLLRSEEFSRDRLNDAIIRFYERYAEQMPEGAEKARARAITRSFDVLSNALDLKKMEAILDASFECVDHRSLRSWGALTSHAFLEQLVVQRELADDLGVREEDILALQPHACLLRRVYSGTARSSGGRFENHLLTLVTFGESGLLTRIELWEREQEAEALARFDELNPDAEPASKPQPSSPSHSFSNAAVLLLNRMAQYWNTGDWNRFRDSIHPQFQYSDRQSLSGVSHLELGRETYVDLARQFGDMQSANLNVHLLATRGSLLALARLRVQIEGGDVGPSELEHLNIIEADDHGRLVANVRFDADALDAAIAELDARYQELDAARTGVPSGFSNAATDAMDRLLDCWHARDWAGMKALFVPGFVFSDRRSMSRLELDLDTHIEMGRHLGDMPSSKLTVERVMTRGNRLAALLGHIEVAGGDVGPSDLEHWNVFEVDESGRITGQVRFDAEEEAAAIGELDRRYESGEAVDGGAWRLSRQLYDSIYRRDQEAFLRCFAPGFSVCDHRLLGWGAMLRDAEIFFQSQAVIVELTSDFHYRDDHFEMTERAFITQLGQTGTREGGAFENQFILVYALDEEGRIAGLDVYDLEQIDAARSKYAQLNGGTPQAGRPSASRLLFENAATRCTRLFSGYWLANDPEGLANTMAESYRYCDRRSMSQIELGRDEYVPFVLELRKGRTVEGEPEFLATRGDRLALFRLKVKVEGGDVGPSELEHLSVVEVNEAGRQIEQVRFDAENLGAAMAELDRRYGEGEGSQGEGWRTNQKIYEAIYSRNREAFLRCLAPEFRVEDHRILGFGSMLSDVETFYRAQAALVELSPDFRYRRVHFEMTEKATLSLAVQTGTREGGAFESPMLFVAAVATDGRLRSLDVFPLEQIDRARARYEELNRSRTIEHSFENQAALADEQLMRCFNTRDWEGVLACVADEVVFDERRRMVRNTADRKVWLEQFRLMYDLPESRFTIKLLATRGERLSLHRHEFNALVAEGAGPLEMEPHLTLHEIDEQGRITAIVLFDLQGVEAAYAELDSRYESLADGDELAKWKVLRTFTDGANVGDWETVKALCSSEFAEYDHRGLAVLGTAQGVEPWIRNFQVQYELAPDTQYRAHHFRVAPRGYISTSSWLGSREGGDYEIPLVPVVELNATGLISRVDLYDIDRPGEAWARYSELRGPEGVESGPGMAAVEFDNAVTDAMDRLLDCWHARDWAGMKALFVPEFVFSDRRSMSHLELDLDTHLEMGRHLGDMPSSRLTFNRIMTRGNRLAALLGHIEVAGGDVGPSDLEHWNVFEVDESGRITGQVRFDAEEEAAAIGELDRRYESGEAVDGGAWRLSRELYDSIYRRDQEAFLRCFAPGFRVLDHRLLGWGPTLRDAEIFFRSQAVIVELSSDFHYREDHFDMTERAVITQLGQVGTREGGAFENQFILVYALDEEGRIAGLDVYDLEQIDAARARYEALNRGSEKVEAGQSAYLFENIPARLNRRFVQAWNSRDWEAIASIYVPDLRIDDRRSLLQLETVGNSALDGFRFYLDQPESRWEITPLATRGDRLVLSRIVLHAEAGHGGGPLFIEYLVIDVGGEEGRLSETILFDPDDLDAAVAELDTRYEKEQPVHGSPWRNYRKTMEAIYRRDRETALSLQTPENKLVDHRVLGWGETLTSPEKFYDSQIALLDLAPDFRMRFDHFEITGRAVLAQLAQVGTREGGPFESPFLLVGGVDGDGRFLTVDIYGLDQVEAARARYEALKRRPPEGNTSGSEEGFANAAFRNAERCMQVWQEGDYDRVGSLIRPDYVVSDRRKSVQLELNRESTVEFSRIYGEMEVRRVDVKLIATRGDRLSLDLTRVELADPDVEAAETVYLNLQEVDEHGLATHSIRWEETEVDAAFAELDARYEAGEGKSHPEGWSIIRDFSHAVSHRQWDVVEAMCAPEFVEYDHRPFAILGTTRGGDRWVKNFTTLVGLATDTVYRTEHFRGCRRGFFSIGKWYGTNEGGNFEIPLLPVGELNDQGQLIRIDLFDPDRPDEAWARFHEIESSARSVAEPSIAESPFANAASRACQRLGRLFVGDRGFSEEGQKHFRSLVTPDYVYSVRRKAVLLELGVPETIEYNRSLMDMADRRLLSELLATRGERLALVRTRFEVSDDVVGPSEFNHLSLYEMSEQGLIKQMVCWDEDDLDVAYAELDARYDRMESGGSGAWPYALALQRTISAHDWDRLRSLVAPGFQVHDQRLLGLGEMISDADQLIRSQAALVELSPDYALRIDHIRTDDRVALEQVTQWGTRDGGAWEKPYLAILMLDDEGLSTAFELFELADIERARARFEELKSGPSLPGMDPSPFANMASRSADRSIQAWMEKDWDAAEGLFTADYRVSDRRKSVQLELDRDAGIEFSKEFAGMDSRQIDSELIATRGECLALMRWRIALADKDAGPSEIVYLVLVETNEQGLQTISIRWDEEEMDTAYAELDARYGKGEGAGADTWLRTRELQDAMSRHDWEGLRAILASGFHIRDHRLLSFGNTLSDIGAFIQSQQALAELSPDFRYRMAHFETRSRVFLTLATQMGTREGGAWESTYLCIGTVNAAGLLTGYELYNVEDLETARARYEELAGEGGGEPSSPTPPDSVFANAASRACERLSAAFRAGEVDRLRPVMSEDFRFSDRRKAVQLELGYEETVKFTRSIEKMESRDIQSELLATRGDRLALLRLRTDVADEPVGPSEFHHLNLYEVNEQGLLKAVVRWDEEDLDAAYEELDARYEMGEGAGDPDFVSLGLSFRDAFRTGQFEAVLQRCSPDFVRYDHRPLAVLGTAHGAEAWLQEMASLMELAPDAVLRNHHLRLENRASLTVATWYGTREGGNFEIPIVLVLEADAETQLVRADLYDPEQIAQAFARFEEIGRGKAEADETSSVFENLAAQRGREGVRMIETNDFDRFREIMAESFRHIDRRKMAQLELDREQYVEFTRDVAGGRSVRVRVGTVATRGERLALLRILAEVEQGDVGPSELEHLNLVELDAEGRLVRQVRFDTDDLDAAFEELDACFEKGEGAIHPLPMSWMRRFSKALEVRDWDAVAEVYAPGFVGEDHRLVGWGTLRGPQQFLTAFKEMVELAPDVRMRFDHVRFSFQGVLAHNTWFGTRDGGFFESPFVAVARLNRQGQVEEHHFYDPPKIDQAMARFAELAPPKLLDLRMPPYIEEQASPVLKAWREWLTALDAGLNADDWEPVRAITSPDVRFEDRQRWALVSGDREIMIESLRARKAQDARVEASLLGMAADRVAAVRMLWSGGPANGRFEVEYIGLIEINEAGLLTATLLFDADALHDLQREMWERWAAIDPSCRDLTQAMRGLLAFNARDRDGLRRAMAPDLRVEDHRRTGMGRLEGPEAYLRALEALWALSESSHAEIGWFWLAQEGSVGLTFLHLTGVNADGGAFESESLYLLQAENRRVKRLELFEMDAMERALARFEELRPDPLRIPPNAATRVEDRLCEYASSGNWEALQDLYAEGVLHEDRRRLFRNSGNRESILAELKYLFGELTTSLDRTLLATAGDQLELEHWIFNAQDENDPILVEALILVEIDIHARIVAVILFDVDPEGRAAAHAELLRRYANHDPHVAQRGNLTMFEAVNHRDLSVLHSQFAEDFVLDDHRRTGLGQLRGGKSYLDSIQALLDLSPELKITPLCFHRSTERGSVIFARTSGLNAEGGEFESFYLAAFFFREGKVSRLEFYEPEDLDAVLRRFDALTADADSPA